MFIGCGCSNNSFFIESYNDDVIMKKHELKFQKDIKQIFSEIDSNREKIRTVSEKESFENKIVDKVDGTGTENFFRSNVLKRFKNE